MTLTELAGGDVRLFAGDCVSLMRDMAAGSIDAAVTDPPYDLAFMGKAWDRTAVAFRSETWAAVYRLLKPGAHLLAFGGTRTYHRMAVAIEDAGFEIRDQIGWLYGSGFPKSLDVSKAIDGAAGMDREIVAVGPTRRSMAGGTYIGGNDNLHTAMVTAPATPEAARWQGWGTALKPAQEPVVVGVKPITVAQHFAMVIEEITAIVMEAALWSNVAVNAAARALADIQARCAGEADTVLDGARMRSLESTGIAKSAARSSTFSGLVSLDLIRTRGCSALSHVRQLGSAELSQESETQHGAAADILTRLMAMSTSVMVEGMSASIVSSWLGISADLLREASRFTIETASKLTIALRTLNSSLLPSITGDTGHLRPSWEPIVVARKPLIGTVAANVLAHSVGALNIDGCRVELNGDYKSQPNGRPSQTGLGDNYDPAKANIPDSVGRWPANVIHDGSPEVMAAFPETSSIGHHPAARGPGGLSTSGHAGQDGLGERYAEPGSAARFFYTAKADSEDRAGSKHPTIKPIDLMRYLCRLVTPPGGLILDPFAGTGTTGIAAIGERFRAILIEKEPEYVADILKRFAKGNLNVQVSLL